MKFLSRFFSKPYAVSNAVLSNALNEGKRVADVDKTLRDTRDVIEAERDMISAFGEMARDLSLRKAESEERLGAILELRRAEKMCRIPDKQLQEAAKGLLAGSNLKESETNVEAVFKERLWDLELALEDRGWVRETTLAALEFSRYGVQQLIKICRVYGIKNPIIKRISEICELYVFGRGIEIRSDDDASNQVIQDFLDDNDAEMGHNGLASKEKDIQTDGSLYFGLPTDPRGNVRVLMVDPLEIMDVITSSDDTSRPLYFKRMWDDAELDVAGGRQVSKVKQCWYPALELVQTNPQGPDKPPMLGGLPVNWDMPILRDKIGAPTKWRWGVPPVYAAVDWARAYKDALEDYATVRRTLARFALMVETKGGPGAIAAYNALFSTTFANSGGTQIERNPPPVVGAVHTSGPGNKIEAFKSAGAQANPEETRRLLLMCCCAAGLPDTFLGDLSQGSLATATSLDRPTELKFTAIQRRWKHTITKILQYVLAVSASSPQGRLREARKKNPAPQPVKIIVKFPNVIEHSIKDMIGAIVDVATLGGRQGVPAGVVDRRTFVDLLLAEIGVEDRDEKLDEMGYGDKYDAQADIEDQRTQAPPQGITGTDANSSSTTNPPTSKAQPPKEALREAVKELAGAIKALKDN